MYEAWHNCLATALLRNVYQRHFYMSLTVLNHLYFLYLLWISRCTKPL